MSNVQFYPKGLKPRLKGNDVVNRLTTLRREIEKDTAPIADLSVPAVLLLRDICHALGLSLRDQETVLGRRGVQSLRKWSETPAQLTRPSKHTFRK